MQTIRAGILCILMAAPLFAQQPDTTRRPSDTTRVAPAVPPAVTTEPVVADTSGPRPERRPPISPRRAFLYSLLVPGYAQSILGRTRAGALEIAFESVIIVMIRQSAMDLHEARANAADSIPVSFIDATGAPRITFRRTSFPTSLIRSRRAHLEDWIAVLIANHLFSAADGYVAALLWDLPSEIAVRPTSQGVELGLRLHW